MEITFPKIKPKKIVETEMMRRAINRTLAVYPQGGFVVWGGRSRIGKTVTARYMVEKIGEHYDPDDPKCFRAHHYETGGIGEWSGHEIKRSIRSLYHATIGRMDEHLYRQSPPEDLAAHLIHGLQRKRLGLVLIDEAGCLTVNAIRGLALAGDVASNLDWQLLIILVGMDDLPEKMLRLPQISGRVHEWCYFEPYSLKETWQLVAELHPHFASLDRLEEEHIKQVSFIHETYGGLPGLIVPFLSRLEDRWQDMGDKYGTIDVTFLRAVHMSMLRDKDRAIEDSKLGYKGVVRGATNNKKPQERGKPRKNRKGGPTGAGRNPITQPAET